MNNSEFQNFLNGNYYKPNTNEIPSLYRDYQIYVMNQISEFNLIKGDKDKILYYWLKGLNDETFQKLHYQFIVLRNEVSDFRESFDHIVTSYCDIPLDNFIISSCSDDDGIVEDDFQFHLHNKVHSIIKSFVIENEPQHSKIFKKYFDVGIVSISNGTDI